MPDEPSPTYGQDRQVEVFLAGMEGETPDVPVDYEELEREAMGALDQEAYNYVAGGAGEERTVDENRRAFDRWQIVPRLLRDVEGRDLSVDLFGQILPVPFLLAPIGVLHHPRGRRTRHRPHLRRPGRADGPLLCLVGDHR